MSVNSGDRVMLVNIDFRFDTVTVFDDFVREFLTSKWPEATYSWCPGSTGAVKYGNAICTFPHPKRLDKAPVLIVAMDNKMGFIAVTPEAVKVLMTAGKSVSVRRRDEQLFTEWRAAASSLFPDIDVTTPPEFGANAVVKQVLPHPSLVGQFVMLVELQSGGWFAAHAAELRDLRPDAVNKGNVKRQRDDETPVPTMVPAVTEEKIHVPSSAFGHVKFTKAVLNDSLYVENLILSPPPMRKQSRQMTCAYLTDYP